MNSFIAERIILAVIFVIPGLLHALGLYLFLTTPITRLATNQKLYFINISVCTLCKSVLKIAYEILKLLHFGAHVTIKIWTLDAGALFLCYIFFLTVLTFDRFLEIYLNIKYPLWSTRKSTLLLIALSWCMMAVTWLMFWFMDDSLSKSFVILYLWPTLEGLFLIVAIFVYSYLFTKIRENRRKLATTTGSSIPRADKSSAIRDGKLNVGVADKSSEKTTCKSRELVVSMKEQSHRRKRRRFYIPTLFVATFVMFWCLPDMVDFGLTISGNNFPSYMDIPLNILISIAMCSDAIIYMMLVVELRRRLKKFICNIFYSTDWSMGM